ncbi:hypothetical protein ACFYE9_20295 [Rhizobium leguminosarum]|uniref:hypothetical protein n=1 Tax=Rhizobium leguminosarum TaxID=384 RepID=UPI0036DA6CAE
MPRKEFRRRAADAGACAGDDGDLVVEKCHIGLSWVVARSEMLKHQAMQPPVSRAGREKCLWPNRKERRRVPIDALMAVRKYRDSPYKTVICGDLHSHACVDVSVIVHRIIDLCFV